MMKFILVLVSLFVVVSCSIVTASEVSRCDTGFLQSVCPASHPVCCFQPIAQIWAACCPANSLCKLDEGICITYPSREAYINGTSNSSAASNSYLPSPLASDGGFDMSISLGAISIAVAAVILIVGVAASVAVGMWASLKYDLYRVRREQMNNSDDDEDDEDEEAEEEEEEEEESDEDDEEFVEEAEEDHDEHDDGAGSTYSRSQVSTARGGDDDDDILEDDADDTTRLLVVQGNVNGNDDEQHQQQQTPSATTRVKHHRRRSSRPTTNGISSTATSELQPTPSKLNKATKKVVRRVKKEKEEPPSGTECILCYTRPKNTVLLPCGHMVTCQHCSDKLAEKGICAICRTEIRATVKVLNRRQQERRRLKREKEEENERRMARQQQEQQEQNEIPAADVPSSSTVLLNNTNNNDVVNVEAESMSNDHPSIQSEE